MATKKTMNIKKLLGKYGNYQILPRLIEIYPDQKQSIVGYTKILKALRKIKPEPSDLTILPSKWNTGGRGKKGEVFAIGFCKWQEWLGMDIETKTHGLTVLCYCLWEMSWSGFSQQQIQGKMRSIKAMVRDVEKLAKEKKGV